ncbi:hypothetical protein DBR18_12400 [Pseudomonas sp. HMWF021]|nr:hypothetical protein DBR18_12400 [Pseudomonas sp. HMWF021]
MWERACSRRRPFRQSIRFLTHRFRQQAGSHSFTALLIFRSCDAVHWSGARPGHSRTGTDCAPAP